MLKTEGFLSRRGLLAMCAAIATGALSTRVARALPAIGHRINVADFGAIGDGKHDCTDAFQAACDAATNGEVVYMPPGTYRIDAARGFGCRGGKNIKMTGAGSDKTSLYWHLEGG